MRNFHNTFKKKKETKARKTKQSPGDELQTEITVQSEDDYKIYSFSKPFGFISV